MAGRYEDAVIALEKSISIDTDFFPGYFYITCVYALLNRGDEANNAVKNVIRLNPKFSLKVWTKKKGYIKRTVLEKMVDCLRKAGLPE